MPVFFSLIELSVSLIFESFYKHIAVFGSLINGYIIGGLIQTAIQYFYGPHKMLAKERVKELTKQADFEEGQIKKLGK